MYCEACNARRRRQSYLVSIISSQTYLPADNAQWKLIKVWEHFGKCESSNLRWNEAWISQVTVTWLTSRRRFDDSPQNKSHRIDTKPGGNDVAVEICGCFMFRILTECSREIKKIISDMRWRWEKNKKNGSEIDTQLCKSSDQVGGIFLDFPQSISIH